MSRYAIIFDSKLSGSIDKGVVIHKWEDGIEIDSDLYNEFVTYERPDFGWDLYPGE